VVFAEVDGEAGEVVFGVALADVFAVGEVCAVREVGVDVVGVVVVL